MSSDVAVGVRGLSKAYWLRHGRASGTLAETLVRRVRNPFGRAPREQFWALRDVDFDIRRGEVVGLIGRNGAGKSTLLKILSRITEMTTGEIELRGRVGSLLEVGTGFHQDLTGRENIFMNGAMLGMTRAEIRSQFDAVVAFAGVDRFLDTPVKHYSSGMYVRLAFAVAAHLRSEILIVDEVLAVGDAEFQAKCLGKMREVSTDGRTVILVSHNMHSISLLCERAIVLGSGRLTYDGPTPDAIAAYVAQFSASGAATADDGRQRRGSGEYRFERVWSEKDVYSPDEARRIRFRIQQTGPRLGRFYPSAHLTDHRGLAVLQMDGRLVGGWIEDADSVTGELQIRSPWLKPGTYHVDMHLCTDAGLVDIYPQAARFEVGPILPYPHSADAGAVASGVILADFGWRVDKPGAATPAEEVAPCLNRA